MTRTAIRIGISASALVCRGLRRPSHGLHGRPRAQTRYTQVRWVADIRNSSSREHLWSAAVRSAYTTASSAVVHPIMSLRSSHLLGDHCLDFWVTAVAAACSLCHDHVFPLCPDFGSAPRAQAAREHRWRHIEHLLFECQCLPGLDGSVALALLRCDLFRVCSGSDHAEAVLLSAFPASRVPVVAATACVVPFLLDPAAALGLMSPWHMKLRCLDLVAAFLLGVSLRCAPASPRPRLSWHAFPCLLGPPSVRGCSASELSSILPRRTRLRLILFCTCPPLCAGALWPMPAWIWRDVRSFLLFFSPFFLPAVLPWSSEHM